MLDANILDSLFAKKPFGISFIVANGKRIRVNSAGSNKPFGSVGGNALGADLFVRCNCKALSYLLNFTCRLSHATLKSSNTISSSNFCACGIAIFLNLSICNF